MVSAIIRNWRQKVGMKALAEGIETEDEWRLLVDPGARSVQGYFFCRPIPAAGD